MSWKAGYKSIYLYITTLREYSINIQLLTESTAVNQAKQKSLPTWQTFLRVYIESNYRVAPAGVVGTMIPLAKSTDDTAFS